MQQYEPFTEPIIQKLQYYVYRLMDPRNGETFYIGKGKGNRIFSHINIETSFLSDEDPLKVKRIREIQLAGFQVNHIIHRHGLDEKTAFEIEAALIDAYPGLSNIASGHDKINRGALHVIEIIQQYSQQTAEIKHKALLISVNETAKIMNLYDATRYQWKVLKKRAEEAEIILPCYHGVIIGAFIAEEWICAKHLRIPGRESEPGYDDRYGFRGYEAPQAIKDNYIGKQLPEKFRFGTGNPIRYTY